MRKITKLSRENIGWRVIIQLYMDTTNEMTAMGTYVKEFPCCLVALLPMPINRDRESSKDKEIPS